jgi:hypothetical protein
MPTARLFPWLTAAALTLYAGRLLAESLRPGVAGVLLIVVLALLGATLLARWRPGLVPWQALILLVYVFYPAAAPVVAVLVGFLALLAALLAQARFPAWRWPALVLFAGALLLYTATVAPGVLPADSGELQLVAAELGVAHPPGFPLYTMLAHLFTRLPLGEGAALRANVFSALVSAGTVALVYLAARRLTGQALPGLIAGFALLSATTFWSQATTANVRSLAGFFTALLFYLLLRWREEPQSRARLAAVALALSLGIGHHASLAFMALIFILYLIVVDPGLLRQPRRWPAPLGAALLGLLPLLYLPLRAGSGAHGADPALATAAGFLEHVLATGFRGDFFAFAAPGLLAARLAVMGSVLSFQFEPLLLGGMVLGVVALMWARRWRLLLLLGGSFAAHTLVTAMYRAPQTVEYMLPAYVAAALLLAVGAAAPWRGRWAGEWRALLQAALLLATVVQAARQTASFRMLHEDDDAARTIGQLLAEAPEGSLLLAGWHWATPLWYQQRVEGTRPDVEVAYVFPTGEPYAETWARRIAGGLAEGRPVIATHYDEAAYANLPPPLPAGEAFLFPAEPLAALPEGFTPVELALGEQVLVGGYQLEPAGVAAGEEAVLTVEWRPLEEDGPPLSLFTHLVGPDGTLWAQHDAAVAAQPDGWALARLPLVALPGTPPGQYQVMIGAYTADGTPLPVPGGEARLSLASLAVTEREATHPTQQPFYWGRAGGDRTLAGYDWDHTLPTPRLYLHWRTASGCVTEVRDDGDGSLPPWYGAWGLVRRGGVAERPGQHYVPLGQGLVWLGEQRLDQLDRVQVGERLYLPQRLAASAPVLRDLVVSVRLVGYEPDGFHWAWWRLDDGVPALGAVPTLKWVAGTRIWDPRWLQVAADAPPGQELGGFVRLYDAFTGQPLPILDERIGEGLPAIPLGRAVVGE